MCWRLLRRPLLGLMVTMLVAGSVAYAHEVRPAYLQIDEVGPPGRYQVLWRTPVLSGMRLPVVLLLPDDVHNIIGPIVQQLPDSVVERSVIDAGGGGLAGRHIEFAGLQATLTDVLVRVQMLDGTHSTMLVRPSQPWVEVAPQQGFLVVSTAYLEHGIEHILFGFDHLLFILALILIVRSTPTLLLTVTAFTLAHSITLSLATLDVVHVPGPPVEACIALSILLVATEIVRFRRGALSLTASRPWVVAFSFGLLHGLGFASALIDIGLPQRDVPLALFAFNVGVEAGQLMFICAVLGAVYLARWLPVPAIADYPVRTAAGYLIGSVAAFWFIERLAAFWT